jgi:hypothetical protein
MKMFLVLMLFVFISCQDDVTPVAPEVVKNTDSQVEEIVPAEEDCDDKFEKAKEEEKKIDQDNLFGQKNDGDEGCTIE